MSLGRVKGVLAQVEVELLRTQRMKDFGGGFGYDNTEVCTKTPSPIYQTKKRVTYSNRTMEEISSTYSVAHI